MKEILKYAKVAVKYGAYILVFVETIDFLIAKLEALDKNVEPAKPQSDEISNG